MTVTRNTLAYFCLRTPIEKYVMLHLPIPTESHVFRRRGWSLRFLQRKSQDRVRSVRRRHCSNGRDELTGFRVRHLLLCRLCMGGR